MKSVDGVMQIAENASAGLQCFTSHTCWHNLYFLKVCLNHLQALLYSKFSKYFKTIIKIVILFCLFADFFYVLKFCIKSLTYGQNLSKFIKQRTYSNSFSTHCSVQYLLVSRNSVPSGPKMCPLVKYVFLVISKY